MYNMKLTELEKYSDNYDSLALKHLREIVQMFKDQNVDLEGWVLDDYDTDIYYNVYLPKYDDSVDFNIIDGKPCPHWYQVPQSNTDITQVPADSILDAIYNYEK